MSKINDQPDIILYYVTNEKLKSYIFLTKYKAKQWIEKNQHVWDRHEIDSTGFEIEEVLIADTQLIEVFKNNLQEYLV